MKKKSRDNFSANLTKDLYQAWYHHYRYIFPFVSKGKFYTILKAIIEEYKTQIVENSHGIKLDYNLGELVSQWVPMTKEPECASIATNFKTMKIVYRIRGANRRNKYIRCLAFRAASRVRRLVSKSCVDNTEIYKNARRIK